MFVQTWTEVFSSSLQDLWREIAIFVPKLLFAVIVFIIGWVIAAAIGRAIAQIISALKVDKLFQSIGTEQMLARAGLKLNSGAFVGELVKWFIIIVFLVASLDILGLVQVTDFLKNVVLSYLPKVIVASLILIAGAFLSDVMRKIITASAQSASMKSANLAGSITYYAIWVVAFIFALSELGIAQDYMMTLFNNIVLAIALALGLAFGLGGKEAAGRLIERLGEQMKSDK